MMTTEELEMEPGFTTRFDEEWEQKVRNSDRKYWELMKKKKSVLPIGDRTKQKVRNSAKR